MSGSAEIAVVETPMPSTTALTLVRPIAKPTDLLVLHDEVAAIIQKNLQQGVDYDVIPGTGDKPSLLKPGAEKLNLAFGATCEYDIVEQEVEHDREVRWTKKKKQWNNRFRGDKTFTMVMEDGTSLGLYRYVVRCRLVREGRVLASCIGICSTLESKYIDRPRDCENTAIKMAQKRAYVGATLHAYALSNRFTQDVEDNKELFAKAPPPPEDRPPPEAVEEPKAEEPPKRSGYTGSTAHQEILKKTLIAKKIDEALWDEVDRKMLGKSFNELQGVLDEVVGK